MRRRSRRLVIVLAAIALVVVAARLALDPYATWRTRRVLAGLEGMDARFSDVTVSVLLLSYEIRDLRIEKRAGAGRALPFFEARRIRFGVLGGELLRRRLVGRLDLERPKLNLIQVSGEKEKASEA